MKKRVVCLFLVLLTVFLSTNVFSLEIKSYDLDAKIKSAVLMDAETGALLFEYNKDAMLPPASVTKIMTLLLIFEEIDSGNLKYDDVLTVSEKASSMGGSQVFLEPGESMTVDDLLKCVIVASANDAALTLAEHVGGSEEAFVNLMNTRAQELGMKNTTFENVTGLDDDVKNHLTSAYDIALMSKELLKHEKVTQYATIWMDTIRNGEFGLSNTNRLVRFYRGITGLKTGSTSKAGFCVSASAKRGDTHLIAVIMGADTSNERNAAATKLLDYGFSNYSTYKDVGDKCGEVRVIKGISDRVEVGYNDFKLLENSASVKKIEKQIVLNESVEAPVRQGDVLGKVLYKIDGAIAGETEILALESIEKMTFWNYLEKVFSNFILI